MSCSNRTGPVNIGEKVNPNPCDLKCQYTYHYNTTSISSYNRGRYLSITLGIGNSQTVNYSSGGGKGPCSSFAEGSSDYSVSEIRIYHESLHKYNGSRADAELIIQHSNAAGRDLIVCIPITKDSGTQPNATSQLERIIDEMSNIGSAINEGGSIQGLPLFDLNEFIPNYPFYSYTASLPYAPCTNCVNYIVFDKDVASIKISSSILNKLKQITKKTQVTTKPITNNLGYAYNKNGPRYGTSGSNRDNIYIDCQPTGENGEILIEKNKQQVMDGVTFRMDNYITQETQDKVIGGIMGGLILLFGMGGISFLIKHLKTKKIPAASSRR
mgnify:CR=1 FL=1|uniref:carbonic anhydrase n=1 Tax=viral metagenome TaxID=1070528 RepID=A0A6C0AXA8_9ZZZZ|tara:strand:+ start:1513 stop:2493 length:981 start_codon:yes stop_codon:yes gene_type:complete